MRKVQTIVSGIVSRIRACAVRRLPQLVAGLSEFGFAVFVLRLIIVAELCLLGVGVVRRLESSYEMAMDAARMQLAALDQQEINDELDGQQNPALLPDTAQDTGGEHDGDSASAANEAPALRPRPVSAIISDETGDIAAAAAALQQEQGNGGAEDTAPEESPGAAGAETAADPKVEALVRRGVTAMIAGDMRRSVLELEQASALAPDHPAMLYYYGLAYDKLLNPHKAREYYTRLFRMRDAAGKYFQRAARRLTYGMEDAAALRGKLSFGPYRVQRTDDEGQGEQVNLLLPVLLAPGEEFRPDDIYIAIQFFVSVNGRKVDFAPHDAELKQTWVSGTPTWADGEENLEVHYTAPPRDSAAQDSSGELAYCGFTAKLYYRGEPLDCISCPSSMILHEQKLNSRRYSAPGGLLPDDGLAPDGVEQAVPYSEEYAEPT